MLLSLSLLSIAEVWSKYWQALDNRLAVNGYRANTT